jgi:EmrB/QacA subfamily drug resistance transporter
MSHWTSRQWTVLLALSFSVFMISLDVTVVTVALPQIQRDLGLTMERLQWVVGAYSLSFGSLLMAGGTFADRFGRRAVFASGLVVFAVASIACGAAGDGTLLTLARVVQGMGAAFMSSSSAALVAGAFEGRERPAAYGVWGAALGLGLAFGPALGGLITEHLSWHWIFFANAPVAAIVLPTVLLSVAEARDPSARTIDLGGMATFSAGLGFLIYGLNAGPHLGWTNPRELAMLAAACAFLVLFVHVERRHAYPLFDLKLFALPTFLGVSLVPIASSVGYWSLFIYLPLYFDRIVHLPAGKIGLAMMPFTLPMLIVPPLAARIARVVAARYQFSAGLALIAGGDWLLAAAIHGGPGRSLFTPLLVAGLGAGLINAQITSVAVSVVPVARAGMASGISATMRQVGYGLGIASLGAVLNIVSWRSLDHALASTPALAGIDGATAFAAFEAGMVTPAGVQGARLGDLILGAFGHGMEIMLAVAGAVTLAGAVAALVLVRDSGIETRARAGAVAPSE